MRLLRFATFIFFIGAQAIHADVNMVEKDKGLYYEVHRNENGLYSIRYAHGEFIGRIGGLGQPVQIRGRNDGKTVIDCTDIRPSSKAGSLLKDAVAKGLVHKDAFVLCFEFDINVVDELLMVFSGGKYTFYRLDLLWLVKQSKADGRFVDKSGAEQDGADEPATAVESKAKGKKKTKPESEGRSQ